MRVSFKIDYQTVWGQRLYVLGSRLEFGEWNPDRALEMENIYPGEWELVVDVEYIKSWDYKYLVKDDEGGVLWEWGGNRQVNLNDGQFEEIRIRDFWRTSQDVENTLFHSAFTRVLMQRKPSGKIYKYLHQGRVLRVQVHVPRINQRYVIALLGNRPELGAWKEKDALVMDDSRFPLWSVDIDASHLSFPVEFKYVMYDERERKVISWEEGNNRIIRDFVCQEENSLKVHTDEKFRFPISVWRGAGVAIPVFSIRTDKSGGIGEFPDLRMLVDWVKKTGLKLIQLLPVNETVATQSWLDSYPYKVISVMALHPVYANIELMGKLRDDMVMQDFREQLYDLNQMESVPYEEVHRVKSRYFKLLFDQEMETFLSDRDFLLFFDENKEWLVPYAAFCYLRDQNKTANHRMWKKYAIYRQDEIEELCASSEKHYPDIAVHYFIQYHLDRQLRDASNYARKNGIVLKTDIPIGVSPDSVETWTHPELFNLEEQIGSPPNEDDDMGQNWGYPTYNWERMAYDGYDWWRKRLLKLSSWFDAYRLAHVVGFFRTWAIPSNQTNAEMGYFVPSIPLTRDEIIDAGINFVEERMTRPFIREYFLWDLFGDFTDEVKNTYLEEYGSGKYNLKPEVDTQRKIAEHFGRFRKDLDLPDKETRIMEGLNALVGEVLFIRDSYDKYKFHPRIRLQDTYSFINLDEETRHCFEQLYVDYFYKRHEDLWRDNALLKLPALLRTCDMMVFGDDLGMNPGCVQRVLKELGILTLEVQRRPHDTEVEFGHPSDALYLSVCTTSSHDMTTIRGWWEEDYERSKRFFHTQLGHAGEVPRYMEPWIARDIINQHLWSPAMWAIFPLQDLLAMDGELRWEKIWNERINIPGITYYYWRYRMHLKMEDLLHSESFNHALGRMIDQSGRNNDY